MYEALMIAAAGMNSQQRRIDTIANNVSNINTSGYRAARLDFKDALYTAGIVPGLPRTPEGNQQKGHGTLIAAVTRDFNAGNLYVTERELDLAIEGDGFFELEDNYGNIRYTRNGSLMLTNNSEGYYLTNTMGEFVHDADGMKIRIPDGTASIEISEDGIMKFIGEGEEDLGEQKLGVYTFRNKTGLVAVGNENYEAGVSSGEKFPAEGAIIRQCTLEGSNVNLAEEMTRLIRTQRAFSLSARALKTADDMEGIANSLRK